MDARTAHVAQWAAVLVPTENSNPSIMIVQPAQDGESNDSSHKLSGPRDGRVFA